MDKYYKNILAFNRGLGFKGLTFKNFEKVREAKHDAVVIVGMGGSGLPGEILRGVKDEAGVKVPIFLVKDYDIPALPYKNPGFIFISFSGGTEEVISALSGVNKKYIRIVITGGGKLAALSQKARVPLVLFEQDELVPRQASGLMFYGLVGALKRVLPSVNVPELVDSIQPLRFRTSGEALARILKNKVVLVYASGENAHLSYDWKVRLNENAKAPSFTGILPEINHNEIAGFHKKNMAKNFFALFLSDSGEKNKKIKKRIDLTRKLLKRYGVGSRQVDLVGKTKLEKTWNSILLAEWTSYYLAKYTEIDPFDTELIEAFKKMMKK